MSTNRLIIVDQEMERMEDEDDYTMGVFVMDEDLFNEHSIQSFADWGAAADMLKAENPGRVFLGAGARMVDTPIRGCDGKLYSITLTEHQPIQRPVPPLESQTRSYMELMTKRTAVVMVEYQAPGEIELGSPGTEIYLAGTITNIRIFDNGNHIVVLRLDSVITKLFSNNNCYYVLRSPLPGGSGYEPMVVPFKASRVMTPGDAWFLRDPEPEDD